MKRNLLAAFTVLFGLALFSGAARADYYFEVPQNHSVVTITPDGGVYVDYSLTFRCAPSGQPIDVVDVGFPNNYYDFSSVQAWLDGSPITAIARSSYIPIGVEVQLGGRAIGPNQQGTLRVLGSNPHMVFPDTEDPNLASVEFYPVYYGAQYTTGTTDLKVSIVFPPGAQGEQVKWHYRQFDEYGYDEQNRLVFTWKDPAASPSQQYRFGVSFPRTLVSQVFEPIPESHYTSGGGGSDDWIGGLVFATIAGGIVLMGFISVIRGRHRRMQYFKPVASVETGAVKRGFTAPEAAVLLELPLDKVLSLILLGLVKKGAIRVEKDDNLLIRPNPQFTGARYYEKELLAAVSGNGRLIDSKVKNMFTTLVTAVRKGLVGSNVKKTKAYYRSIIDEAWKQVMAAGTNVELAEAVDKNAEWMMADKKAPDRLKDAFGRREVPPPVWWSNFHPRHASTVFTPSSGPNPVIKGIDFADAFASRLEAFADRTVSNMTNVVMGVTDKTNPVPVTPSSGRSSGGGRSCACACACAGCACACAGGGR